MTQHFTVNRGRAKQGQLFAAKRSRFISVAPQKESETDIQRCILALLAKHPSVAFAHRINSRVLDVDDKHSKTGKRPMRMAPKGLPDIAGMLRTGHALYIECKSADGTLTEEQACFLARVNEHRGVAFVARSIDDVLRHIPLPSARAP